MTPKHIREFVLTCAGALAALITGSSVVHADTVASLLGNFTVNQFCRLTVGSETIDAHYTVVYGQLPALRELHNADADGNGVTTQAERDTYVGTLAPGFAYELHLVVDGVIVPLHPSRWTSSLPTEQGGFSLRVDVDFTAALPPSRTGIPRAVQFSNQNYSGQLGWHEIVVTAVGEAVVFDTNAYSTSATDGLTEALQALPASGPLDERTVYLSMSVGAIPAGAVALRPRPNAGIESVNTAANGSAMAAFAGSETSWISRKTRGLITAISAPRLEPRVAVWALLAALLLGAGHALSPGHGKTLVGAYLIGSRGTPRHAVFLGFTVTVTHTLGVFALGFATLYASRFVVPERLFPILSLISAVLVLSMGVVLLVQRGRAASRALRPWQTRGATMFFPFQAIATSPGARQGLLLARTHAHVHNHSDGVPHSHADGTMHSHGGGPMHSHLPSAAGERVTWKSLLTLGISGGLVPCPSAMVLLLAAIALNKTAYGMLLVLIFSVGLAMTLTAVGLIFLYARNRLRKPSSAARWPHVLPVVSAATITVLGVALCFGALKSFG